MKQKKKTIMPEEEKREKTIHPWITDASVYKPQVVFVSTYLPKRCGIATFTNNLLAHYDILNPSIRSGVVALNEFREEVPEYPEEVRFVINQKEGADYEKAARFVNSTNYEIVCLQHEFGIFGGEWGEYILKFLQEVKKPVVTTLHTILPQPSSKVRTIIRQIAKGNILVVMTPLGKQILREVYGISSRHIEYIPHGVPASFLKPTVFAKEKLRLKNKTVILTFGFLSPNKGLEYVIRALPLVLDEHPEIVYLIVGITHPNEKKNRGEQYREFLLEEARRLGCEKNVFFHNQFFTTEELLRYLEAADIYITPYLNPDQITSGTLSYALGCGKAIISTSYLYAKEVIGEGKKGVLVEFRNPQDIANKISFLLENPEEKRKLERESYKFGSRITWQQVSHRYLLLFSRASEGRKEARLSYFEERHLPVRLTHLRILTDDMGIIQHAKFSTLDRKTGYTTDDNARALIVVGKHYQLYRDELSLSLINTYLGFLYFMQKSDGWSHNYLGYDRSFLDESGSEDCLSRVLWATGFLLTVDISENLKNMAKHIFLTSYPQILNLKSLRAKAITIQGLFCYYEAQNEEEIKLRIKLMADSLVESYHANHTENWSWFEDVITYANAKLPLGLLLAYKILGDEEYKKVAMETLDFLCSHTIIENRFWPVGNRGWFPKNGKKALFDQQPIESKCMVETLLTAYQIFGQEHLYQKALLVFDWFLGRNTQGEMLYDPVTGGCYDGIMAHEINLNQGAESTIAYLLARLDFEMGKKETF